MNTSARAPAYDLFKWIVAIILLILFLLLLWRGNASAPSPTAMPLLLTRTVLTAEISPTQTTTSPAPSPSETPTTIPDATPTEPGTMTVSTTTSEPDATATPIPATSPHETACELAGSRSRLQVGTNATIVRRLNFRSSPGIQDNWLRTNNPGTAVKIVDGPVCLPYASGAYVWWQVQLPDGQVGWSAEGSVHGTFYFVEPGS